jgi:branched-chain amino acid transport system permease protein
MIWWQTLVNGVTLGGLYALVAVGLSFVWGITNILNFAHGGMIMLGAYVTFWLFHLYGIDPFLSVPISMVVLFGFGLAVYHLLLRSTLRRADFIFLVLLLTFALEMAMSNGAALLWTADFRSVTVSYSGWSIALGRVFLPVVDLAVLGVGALLILLLWLYLTQTKAGQAILATGLDPEAAQLMGIEVGRTYALTFAIGSALAGAAGSLVATLTAVNPYFGGAYTFRAALVGILGGLGSIPGVLLGGLVVGMAETFGSVLISPAYRLFVSFVLLVLILLVRPSGLLGSTFFGQIEE